MSQVPHLVPLMDRPNVNEIEAREFVLRLLLEERVVQDVDQHYRKGIDMLSNISIASPK